MHEGYKNRKDAGAALAQALAHYAGEKDTLVLALPRGGVPVAFQVAQALSLPMDIWLARKLGVPEHAELAMGAIAMGGVCYVNKTIASEYHVPESAFLEILARERAELERRDKAYRNSRPLPNILGKTVIVVDDGLATGATMHAAVQSLASAGAGKIIVAVPVGSWEACRTLETLADEVVCLLKPTPFNSVGQWYEDFSQTTDDEVRHLSRLCYTYN